MLSSCFSFLILPLSRLNLVYCMLSRRVSSFLGVSSFRNPSFRLSECHQHHKTFGTCLFYCNDSVEIRWKWFYHRLCIVWNVMRNVLKPRGCLADTKSQLRLHINALLYPFRTSAATCVAECIHTHSSKARWLLLRYDVQVMTKFIHLLTCLDVLAFLHTCISCQTSGTVSMTYLHHICLLQRFGFPWELHIFAHKRGSPITLSVRETSFSRSQHAAYRSVTGLYRIGFFQAHESVKQVGGWVGK
jgi:hypothetical protein